MPTFSSSADLPCTPERFWALYDDDAWFVRMLKEGLRFEVAEVQSSAPSPRRRSVRAVPRIELPGPVRAVLGTRMAYTEHGEFDGSVWKWRVVVDAMPERIRLQGKIRVEPLANGQCRRLDEASIEVDVFGVRGAIERVFETSVRDNWLAAAAFTRRELQR